MLRTSGLPADLGCHPDLADVVVTGTARSGARQLVLHILRDGRPAILKCYLGPSAAPRCQAARARLRLAGQVMGGDDRAVRILTAIEPGHALILSRAPGLPMQQVLEEGDAGRRLAVVRRSGEWLARLISARGAGPFPAWRLQSKLVARAAAHAADPQVDPALIAPHLDRMAQIARRLHLRPVQWGIGHGDFHPQNLFVAAQGPRLILTGFDMEVVEPIPVVRDLAKMLVWLQSQEDRDDEDRACISGIDRPLVEALLASHPSLSADDRLALHFHIGEQMAEFYLQRGARLPALRPRMAEAMARWAKGHARMIA